MEVTIIDKNENKLLDREEIIALVEHPGEPTPKREEIRKRIAAILGISEDLVVVHRIHSVFGWAKSRVYANVYKNKEDIFKIEPKYILKRNSLLEKGE